MTNGPAPKFQLMPHKVPTPREPGDRIGQKRPALRSINDLKNFMLESIELHAAGQLTAAEMRSRTAAAKDTAEVHAAVKLMELQGISFDMQAEATGLNYHPVIKRTRTQRSGMTIKGPIEEDITQEVQEAAGDDEAPISSLPHRALVDRLAFGETEEDQSDDDADEDTIPW